MAPQDDAGFDRSNGELSMSDITRRGVWPDAGPRLLQQQAEIENRFFEQGATVHFDRLPELQFYAPLVGLSSRGRTQYVVNYIFSICSLHDASRKLTQSEIDALAECAAKNYRRHGWAPPATAAITLLSVYSGRETFRFPFVSPKNSWSWFNHKVFFSQKWAFLRGPPAAYAWHFVRFVAYYPLVGLATRYFVKSYISMSMAAAIITDPRLRGVHEATLQKVRQEREHGRFAMHGRRTQETEQQGELSPADRQQRDDSYARVGLPPPTDVLGRPNSSRSPAGQTKQSADDWKSQEAQTGDNWDNSDVEFAPIQQTPRSSQQTGAYDQPTSTSTRTSWWRGAGSSQEQTQESPPPRSSTAWDDTDLFNDGDDASPTSPTTRKAELRGQGQGQAQATSSWDRLRQQAKANTSPFLGGDRSSQDTVWGQLRKTELPRTENEESSAAYSESDKAMNRSRNQAQKEFDAMLEAERHGGSRKD
ncbi:hypothetical protein BX600DRAFT_511257 [Xylariales sp. PMI_506]|nr:hypothetical protein BX600DRAFT_511257 [Xylariales sp. PMI_506]